VPVGFAIDHRFAFFYWLQLKKTLRYDRHTQTQWRDDEFVPPDLVTWDWHDDCGGECDFIKDELERLDQGCPEEVALFCWAGLRTINDGHIAPALWLNALGNVYIVQKQHHDYGQRSRVAEDRYAKPHRIIYVRSLDHLPDVFNETNSGSGVVWDIDLDYFTQAKPVPDQAYTPPVPRRKIMSLLSGRKEWMQIILGDLKGITIALEPTYTGGLSRSLELYHVWEHALFCAPLFSKKCRWKDSVCRMWAGPL
jgi:hypothetical protein